MQIDHGVFEFDVAEQQLDRAQVRTRLQADASRTNAASRCAETRFSIWARVAAD